MAAALLSPHLVLMALPFLCAPAPNISTSQLAVSQFVRGYLLSVGSSFIHWRFAGHLLPVLGCTRKDSGRILALSGSWEIE